MYSIGKTFCCDTYFNRLRLEITWKTLEVSLTTASSIVLHFANLSNNVVRRKKKTLLPEYLSQPFILRKAAALTEMESFAYLSLTEDFHYNSSPVYSLFYSGGDGEGACIFMVINTCTQSFNLPYLSHVTVWLHCLIWVSFNLSPPRLEINEGRKRHIWVAYSVRGKRAGMNGRRMSFIWQCFPFFPLSVIRSLSFSFSLPWFNCQM